MRIAKVTIHPVQMEPLFVPWHLVVVRVSTDEGLEGFGEMGLAAGLGNWAGVTMVKEISEAFVLGKNPFQIDKIWDDIYRQLFWAKGAGPVIFGAMSAIDQALWDIKGKALGVPVYELLGGAFRDKIKLYANGWFYDCGVDPNSHADAALKVVADGYRGLKFDPFELKLDGTRQYPRPDMDKELEEMAFRRVKAVREAVGPEIDIMIEAHGGMTTSQAIRMGRRFEEVDPFFLEEPVDITNIKCLKKVSESVRIPIAAGERLYTRFGTRQIIEMQAVDILQPDVGLTGGIGELRKIANHAEQYHIQIQPHNCAGPIATAAAGQVDASIPNFIVQEIFPYRKGDFFALVNNALETRVQDGHVNIPSEPGLGIEVNEQFLAKFEKVMIGG